MNCIAENPKPWQLAGRREHFFKEESFYVWLKADGDYLTMFKSDIGFKEVWDHGKWSVAGTRLSLVSDDHRRNLRTSDYAIFINDKCGVELLPLLRRRIENACV